MVSTMFPFLAKQFEHQRSSNPPLLDLILQSLNVNNESLWNNTTIILTVMEEYQYLVDS